MEGGGVEWGGGGGELPELREPGAAGLPGYGEERGEEEAPGKEPDEVEEPVGGGGELVVVVRVAFAEEAQNMLVDEIEVPPAMHVAEGGNVAVGMAFAGVGKAYEDVPRGGDGEEEERCR